jgi:hypothetical protein
LTRDHLKSITTIYLRGAGTIPFSASNEELLALGLM